LCFFVTRGKMCYIGHITGQEPPAMRTLWLRGSRNIEQGRGSFRAQAVSQKTRKKSASKTTKKAK